MKLKMDLPPNIKRIDETFGVLPQLKRGSHIFFCYGDTIYCPNGLNAITDAIRFHHEPVHCKQQGSDPEGWWEKYCSDREFRLNEEIPAHIAELVYFAKQPGMHVPVPGFRSKIEYHKLKIAQRLSSPLYGGVISTSKAKQILACALS